MATLSKTATALLDAIRSAPHGKYEVECGTYYGRGYGGRKVRALGELERAGLVVTEGERDHQLGNRHHAHIYLVAIVAH